MSIVPPPHDSVLCETRDLRVRDTTAGVARLPLPVGEPGGRRNNGPLRTGPGFRRPSERVSENERDRGEAKISPPSRSPVLPPNSRWPRHPAWTACKSRVLKDSCVASCRPVARIHRRLVHHPRYSRKLPRKLRVHSEHTWRHAEHWHRPLQRHGCGQLLELRCLCRVRHLLALTMLVHEASDLMRHPGWHRW